MLENIKNLFRKGGAKLGMVESLENITDHPKINIPQNELDRIFQNKKFYANPQTYVSYKNVDGDDVEREYHAINVSKVVSKKLSKLVFNDGCKISVDNKKANDFLQKTLEKSKFRKNFGEELEGGYAISGLVLRPYYDENSKTIKIAYCSADSFYPLESNTNDVSEAAIATKTQRTENKKTITYTLLEFHEWINGSYVISNELYRSETEMEIGIKVPLSALDKYKKLQESVTLQGFTRPLFIYIKLAGKNNINYGSPLGLGVIDNAKRQLQDINDKYDEFMWEIEEAKTRIIASDHFFKTRYNSEGKSIQRFDKKTGVYNKLSSDEPFIDEFAPALRASEFIESINFILRVIELNTGFSSGTFSFDGKSVKTATEVISENTETYQTRTDNTLIVGEALTELVITIFELAAAYGLYNSEMDFGINVDFDDGVFSSKEAKLDYHGKAVTLGMLSKRTAIMRQYGVTEKEAIAELERIIEEQLKASPDQQQALAEVSLLGREE
ncbi:phage portal protein [Paenilisteria rocourtiae]|uniref:A118 family predicted phage portal protein n=1 Tax=Listeria rocourtiae TaxID=647910 RepID=A0A4R6ZP59_9LIST|nr:phage portal protein [Listeria rocourtiae]TDR54195.1 A118 family predicted phage portal protein [Listeria rocourtiae]